MTLDRKHWQDTKWILATFAILFTMVTLYIIPLPLLFESILPNKGQIAIIREMANESRGSHFVAVAPAAAWQSLFYLFSPLAVFLFAIQLSRDALRLTLLGVIFIGAISGIIGVLQVVGSVNSPLYLYDVTNKGSAVGLFANRNHASMFLTCLFPILAVVAAGSHTKIQGSIRITQLIAAAVAAMLVPLILVTGSRSGLLTSIIGLIGGGLLYIVHSPSHQETKIGKSAIVTLTVSIFLCLIFVTIYFSRAEAIERIFTDAGLGYDRSDFWVASVPIFWQYLPLGFGPGSFVTAFQNEEPISLLRSAYLNRLHNDWFETGLAFGVPGILLMLSAVIYYVRRTFHLWVNMDGVRSAVAQGRVASVIFAILAISSVSDYPLRTPAIAGFAALVLVWFVRAR